MKNERNRILEAFQAGDFSKVVHQATALLKRRPRDAFAWKAKGTALKQLGRYSEAAGSLSKALEIDFADAECHSNLSSTFTSMGRHRDAEQAAGHAVAIDPMNAEAYLNLGVALRNQFRFSEAKASYLRALQYKPSLVQTYVNLSNLLRFTGEVDDAIAICNQAVRLGYATTQVMLSLALSLREVGDLDGAQRLCREVLQRDPVSADAHNNLAVILIDAGFLEQAFDHCQASIRSKPNFAEAYSNMGLVCRETGMPERAFLCYRKAIKLSPDYAIALNNILFAINCAPVYRPRLARHYGQLFRDYCSRRREAEQYTRWETCPAVGPIVVGMVSGDFGMHPVGYFLRSFLPRVNPKRIRLIAYSTKRRTDEVSAELQNCFSEFHRIEHLADHDAAQLIHSHRVRILFDLSGHTLFNRLPLFSFRPAPVQVSWLGYFATTSLDEIDYILGDPVTLPDREQTHFRERIFRLAGTYFCFSLPSNAPDVSPLPALKAGAVTFGCFNSLAKINTRVIACWAEILLQAPGSRLLLKARQYRDERSRIRVSRLFEGFGVGQERIDFEPHSVYRDYLEAYSRIDLALDPFPYPGGTTTLEALWMGVPTVARKGDRLIGRNADMILTAMKLNDWLANDASEYVEMAVRFSQRLDLLAALRVELRGRLRSSPLMDAVAFAEDFSRACEAMADGSQAGLSGSSVLLRWPKNSL